MNEPLCVYFYYHHDWKVDQMWTIKHIYESDFGCEERMPGEPLTVLVVLESDTGEVMQVEVAENWLSFMELDEGDDWPQELIDEEIKLQDKSEKQSKWMDNYLDAIEGEV